MRYLLLAAVVAGLLTGCGGFKRGMSKLTGDPTRTCYQGVQYLQFPSGASVQYDTLGHVVRCS